jgi:hypothetical protein
VRARSSRIGVDGKALPPVVEDLLPGEQRERFLAMLRTKTPPGVAAREFGLTGSQIRGLRRRDPDFDSAFADAWGEGENYYEERLAVEARLRATEGGSDRILEVELASHGGPKYAHLRRDRVKLEGRMEHAVVIDPSRLANLSLEELKAFERALAKIVEGTGEIVEDAEVVEIVGEIEAAPDDRNGHGP